MSKFDKFKDIFNMVEPLAKPFVPGVAGSILDKVNAGLNNGGVNGPLPDSIKHIADETDQTQQALLALTHVVADQNERLAKLEAK